MNFFSIFSHIFSFYQWIYANAVDKNRNGTQQKIYSKVYIIRHFYSVLIYFPTTTTYYLLLYALNLDVVEWLACFADPESYAGGSLAPGRFNLARKVEGEKPDKSSANQIKSNL